MTVNENVTQFIESHHLIQHGSRLLLGVSGGADSMALLLYFAEKQREWGLELAVCSVDHALRGKDSSEDLNYVACFCAKRDILFIGKKVDARAWSRAQKISLETAARALRYRAFAEAMDTFHADALVLAHHGDDQVETMLMRAVRGTVGIGRAGIPVRRPFAGRELVRPLLSQTKRDLERYCAANGIVSRNDPSNQSDVHTRNRFRKYVLPFLKKENPKVHLKFQYESERITEDESLLNDLAKSQLKSVTLKKQKSIYALSIPNLLAVHPALQRRTIHLVLCYLYTNQQLQPMHQPIHIEGLLQFLHAGRSSGNMTLPGGLTASVSYETCMIGFLPTEDEVSKPIKLSIPGQTNCRSGIFEADTLTIDFLKHCATDASCLIFDPEVVSLPLYVRTIRSGDRMRPNGMTGSQKIQRIFINEKVDRNQRKRWPLITDSKGRVLWLPLLKRGIALPSPRTSEKKEYVKLKFIPFSGFGRTQA
ncbi:tRNA lysidine(34) synthetase TilS [Sporolactobacillus inulinus]|uniref:tRNA(Ile)-lysidine synthase n=2 Tax=Sporolactobacillus inulinus TaxID=2078 RepID=A0A0U1QP07_9BACL|nr:tRNA lysidine(34) synthetase TilS [Sporolactobacillus inulinus]KLI02538.1 tRNA(Ile)-lysidine synthetase [Sporolactobacillus inulinus CASD]GEB78165.1 tRNA(Ile)-lysidine synthase [Sporolactobacillus inulinus]